MYIAILDLNIIHCILDIGFAKAPHFSNEPFLPMFLLVAICLCFGQLIVVHVEAVHCQQRCTLPASQPNVHSMLFQLVFTQCVFSQCADWLCTRIELQLNWFSQLVFRPVL